MNSKGFYAAMAGVSFVLAAVNAALHNGLGFGASVVALAIWIFNYNSVGGEDQ